MAAQLLALGLVIVLRWRRPVPSALSITALAYFIVIMVRVVDPNGAEMATRGLTYVALFSSIPIAVGLLYLCGPRVGRVLPVAIATILIGGGMVSGWPAAWERLPGGVRIAGFESGVEADNLALAGWAGTAVGPERSFACDVMTCALLGSYAHQYPVDDAASIYYAPALTDQVAQRAAELTLDYLVVNQRMAEQTPVTGFYFGQDPLINRHVEPVSRARLDKFLRDPRPSLVYDDGRYQVYDVRALWNG